ncbi:MAG: hypothetical protein IIB44_12570, partial [Candidatus Marinimicrobia bacterium]|nr:hypothetical protein [Candidatus Neomarinimicrobiota bacterium]
MILDIVSPLAKGIPTGKADYYVLTIIITQLKQGATLIRRILWTGQALTSYYSPLTPVQSLRSLQGRRDRHYSLSADRQALFPVCRQAG